MKISMLVGFTQGPFYYDSGNLSESGTNHDIDDAGDFLKLSDELIAEITAWDNEFQRIYNSADPRESGFSSPEVERAWIEKGEALAARIVQGSSVVSAVDYRADGSITRGTCIIR